ncbi:hypothetical protein GCM10011386_44960 [Parapedobacter defluvii]|uniref:Uncharacterized protein n=2 Tax=Parapedobacter defluvii TaxID=2045106 RepID=A0ABQ1MW82_9SPHI|nr:hypothetical protein GCM10011386_44960 [Parapedobacter defluvii]
MPFTIMKKMKNIITGVLSGAVLFMAIQVGVAHEKTKDFVNKLEIKQSTEAWELARTVAMLQASKTISSMYFVQGGNMWFAVNATGTQPSDQKVSQQPTTSTPSGDCLTTNTGQICSVLLNTSSIEDTEAYEELKERIGTANPPSIQDFLDLGATYTGPGNTPVYARLAP